MRLELNFASREYLLLRKLYIGLGAGLAVLAVVLVVLFVLQRGRVSELNRMRAEVSAQQQKLAEARKKLAEYERTIDNKTIAATYNEAAFANAVIRNRSFSWTLFLNRIESLVPDGVGITGITPDFVTLNVDIAGTAKDMEGVTGFIARLTGSEYFEDVPPVISATEEKAPGELGKTQQKFNIKIRYIPEPVKQEQKPAPEKEG